MNPLISRLHALFANSLLRLFDISDRIDVRQRISRVGLAGLLAVLGIAMRNQMLLINHYRRLAREEGEGLDLRLALRGARERVAPILATTCAFGLVMALALLLGDVPGLEFIRPLAIAVLGGLVTADLLNLFLLPALCLSLGGSFVQEPESAQGADGMLEATGTPIGGTVIPIS
jgi:Cu/Ag efflux pump CusA